MRSVVRVSLVGVSRQFRESHVRRMRPRPSRPGCVCTAGHSVRLSVPLCVRNGRGVRIRTRREIRVCMCNYIIFLEVNYFVLRLS